MFDRFETFSTAIANINRLIQSIKTHEVNELGLRGKHVMCLYNLGKNPDGITSSQLSKICSEDKAAVSRAISYLAKSGYVSQQASGDKRAYRAKLFLTEKGQNALEYINKKIENALLIGGKGLSDEHRRIFYHSLMLIGQNLESYEKQQAKNNKNM